MRARCDAGAAGLLVTHEARHAAWADRVVYLRDGRVVDSTEAYSAASMPRGRHTSAPSGTSPSPGSSPVAGMPPAPGPSGAVTPPGATASVGAHSEPGREG